MLYPQINKFRNILDLSGIWKFKVDEKNIGEEENWFSAFESDGEIAVPGSWNEQLEELGLLNYVGKLWYKKSIFISNDFLGSRIILRIGSADYTSKIWVNGKPVGEHNFGFLPFEFDITSYINIEEEAEIVISVDNTLNSETIPQGIQLTDYINEKRLREATYPPARFDYFPFGGIHRPVQILKIPTCNIKKIFVDTEILNNGDGQLHVKIETDNSEGFIASCRVEGLENGLISEQIIIKNGSHQKLLIENCRFWSPKNPFLYRLIIEIKNDSVVLDSYSMEIGIREVIIKNNQLLLNGEPIYLKGFGKHEDFPVIGKGLLLPVVVKDFQIMKWINANSFRTSHYPYAEEIMSLADRQGFLVIDEVPANSLDLRYANERTLENHKTFIKKLFERDYNHPSVIMWALGNEPNLVGEPEYNNGTGKKYWEEIFSYARSIDKVRPMVVPNCRQAGIDDPVLEFSDVIAINRYYGWYEYPGQLELAISELEKEMDVLFDKYNKPIMLTEFGADTIPGLHATSDQIFTEEYQTNMLTKYINLIRSKKYTIGEHVWNFSDFRTSQHFRRVVLNMKGLFSRVRSPKSAAFVLKSLWKEKE